MGAFFRPFTRTWLVPLDLLFGPGKPLQNILVIYKIFVGVILSFPSARKQRLFGNKFRSSEPAEHTYQGQAKFVSKHETPVIQSS